jgi:hypothetical protein
VEKKNVKKKRRQLPYLGLWYEHLLQWDAYLANKSVPQQAHSLICVRLQMREEDIEKRLLYVAEQKGISVEELKRGILDGSIVNGEEWMEEEEED